MSRQDDHCRWLKKPCFVEKLLYMTDTDANAKAMLAIHHIPPNHAVRMVMRIIFVENGLSSTLWELPYKFRLSGGANLSLFVFIFIHFNDERQAFDSLFVFVSYSLDPGDLWQYHGDCVCQRRGLPLCRALVGRAGIFCVCGRKSVKIRD